MKTSELTKAALDWAVAKCEGMPNHVRPVYTTDWSRAGPIIEREWLELTHDDNTWHAQGRGFGEDAPQGYGDTPLIAAMRCYVASKLGDEVEIPKELEKETT